MTFQDVERELLCYFNMAYKSFHDERPLRLKYKEVQKLGLSMT